MAASALATPINSVWQGLIICKILRKKHFNQSNLEFAPVGRCQSICVTTLIVFYLII